MASTITPLIRPVPEPALVTSGYGYRKLNGKDQFHDGIDYVSRKAPQVLAIADGVVCYDMDDYDPALAWTDRRHSGGNMFIVKHAIHGRTYHARYLHIVENRVRKHQHVKQGDVIGVYGDVGMSYGAHLHFDLYTEDWQKVDPTPILMAGLKAGGLV